MTDTFDPAPALAPLKRFQRKTVDHVFRRLYTDPDQLRHFLVADEVGLGKTMVARGVIALAIEKMWDSVGRIDVIYVCSNGAIARQNLNRLNVMDRDAQVLPTRLTMLPLRLGGLRDNKVNFVSLTPGTTFDLKSSTGQAAERALIMRMLEPLVTPFSGAIRLFQVGSGDKGWNWTRTWVGKAEMDGPIACAFLAKVQEDSDLTGRLLALCGVFAAPDASGNWQLRQRRNLLIGELRSILAHQCVAALEPDLIILDEFQRFHDLLHGESEAAKLARHLFDFRDEDGNEARTLLLSATPYRMLTLSQDDVEDGNHYDDFLLVLRFLYGREHGAAMAEQIGREMHRFRKEMQMLPASRDTARVIKDQIETRLRKVMARTERVGMTQARDAMISEPATNLTVLPDDLREARAMAHVARAADAPGIVEYWKSAPYLMNFMRDYKLKDRLRERSENPSPELRRAIRRAEPLQMTKGEIDTYDEVPLRNGRMRALSNTVFAGDLGRRLWLPPSLPYQGAREDMTKALVFSAWSMVPDAIAALLSYESERQMDMAETGRIYSEYKTGRPLQFREVRGRLAGLRALLHIYPSPELARAADPLMIRAEVSGPLSGEDMRGAVATRLTPHANRIATALSGEGPTGTWDWAAPAWLDRVSGYDTSDWLGSRIGMSACGQEDAWKDHVAALHDTSGQGILQGSAEPVDILTHLVDLALGSPATCALRALSRVAPDLALDHPAVLTAAAQIGMGFRTLFHQPESQALLRADDGAHYWRAVLHYCAAHDLQAVLDEYVHILVESEGLIDAKGDIIAAGVGKVIVDALSLRPAQIDVDTTHLERGQLAHGGFKMRGRFAMRLTHKGETEAGEQRTGIVRTAFNSPFRPFVLATTSVGQEGLDFHHYCHRLFHWNLPTNPVDLEQREGRVHRYKSHAVRLNIAQRQQNALFSRPRHKNDPWQQMFDAAWRETDQSDGLHPFWIYEGKTYIERHILALPFSREASRLSQLKQSVAIYRLAFGQPRQDDLLNLLSGLDSRMEVEELTRLQISLKP